MKKITLLMATMAALVLTSCTGTPKLEDKQDTLSWALGRSIAEGLINQVSPSLDKEMVIAAVRATLDGQTQPIDDSTYAIAVSFVRNQLIMEQQTATLQADKNALHAEEAAWANFEKTHPNAKKHPSGFYYEELKAGTGRNAKERDLVLFDYKGYNMLTGELCDQTYGQRDPIPHTVGHPMFPGLIQGFQLMNTGAIYRFYFPSKLYIPGGSQNIPANTPVIYEIELHKIN